MSQKPGVSEERHPLRKTDLTPAVGGNTPQEAFARQLRQYDSIKSKRVLVATIPVTPRFTSITRPSRRANDNFESRPTLPVDGREHSMSSSVSSPSQNTTPASSEV
uniref:Uncharacterized protein n=2 Tax=Bursaphelenchus xylophilus TaxID=6326 RepID=A0A1I7SU64_BURXY